VFPYQITYFQPILFSPSLQPPPPLPPGEKGVGVKSLLDDQGGEPQKGVTVKFAPFSFESRHLTRLDDDALT